MFLLTKQTIELFGIKLTKINILYNLTRFWYTQTIYKYWYFKFKELTNTISLVNIFTYQCLVFEIKNKPFLLENTGNLTRVFVWQF